MKRTSGRIGIGLVLVSLLVGACLTERESDVASAGAVTRPEAALTETRDAKEVVFAVRSQIERAFGTTNVQLPGARAHRSGSNPFDVVGAKTTAGVEFLGTSGVTGELNNAAAEVVLPAHADGAFRLQDARSGVSIEVGLVGATQSVREDVNGYTVYRAGYDKGAHIVQRTTSRGTEDYVFFPDTLPEAPELRYELALGEKVAGLRLVERTLELLDAGGAPRLRMAPPYAVDGDGRRLALNVAIEGCAYDSSTDLPWDRAIVAPGAKHCTVHLTWDSSARAPLVVDPAWALTGEMSVPRLNATSAEFAGLKARVIVVGGDPGDPGMAHATTEVFDEASNTWAMYKTMDAARTHHAMVQAGSASNYALVVIGGKNATGVIASTEKLDLSGVDWQMLGTTGLMNTPRAMHTASFAFVEGAPNSPRILVAGGINAQGTALDTMELFFLNETNWELSAVKMSTPRLNHTATMGKAPNIVVIAGGKANPTGPALASLDYCDVGGDVPACFSPSPMMHARADHKAIREPQPSPTIARIFFIGGESDGTKVGSVDVFDAGAKAMLNDVPAALMAPRNGFDAMLVTGSSIIGKGTKIVVTGGYGADDKPLKSVEWLDTANTLPNKVWQFGPEMMMGRAEHTMAALSDGRILTIGGVTAGPGTSELLQCSKDEDCPMERPSCADGFCCDKPCDGVCEACNSTAPGHTPGICFPIAGEPLETHGSCISADPLNAKCAGQCGGFERTKCVYPEGKPCATACDEVVGTPQSSSKSLTCSDKGICDVVGFETSCGNLTCATDGRTCNVKCTADGGCIKGYQCSVTSGSCVEAQVQCATRKNSEGIDTEVLESVADSTVVVEECGAFKCDVEKAECRVVCNTAYDCATGFTCDSGGKCAKKAFDTAVGEASGCSISPANESSRFGWLAALAIAGAVAARRQRARA